MFQQPRGALGGIVHSDISHHRHRTLHHRHRRRPHRLWPGGFGANDPDGGTWIDGDYHLPSRVCDAWHSPTPPLGPRPNPGRIWRRRSGEHLSRHHPHRPCGDFVRRVGALQLRIRRHSQSWGEVVGRGVPQHLCIQQCWIWTLVRQPGALPRQSSCEWSGDGAHHYRRPGLESHQ